MREGVHFPAKGRSLIVDHGGGIVGVSLRDSRGLAHSPGHVVYIFCRKVEGLYLGVASLEGAGRSQRHVESHVSTETRTYSRH